MICAQRSLLRYSLISPNHNHSPQSPLHLAVLTRQKKVIQYLLKANANPLVCDRDGNTPLHIACRIGFVEGVATLLGRTNHINAEACRIPELNIRNSKGEIQMSCVSSGSINHTSPSLSLSPSLPSFPSPSSLFPSLSLSPYSPPLPPLFLNPSLPSSLSSLFPLSRLSSPLYPSLPLSSLQAKLLSILPLAVAPQKS